MENSQQVNPPDLPSSTQETPASASRAALPESPKPAGPGQYSLEEALRLSDDLTHYVFEHIEVQGCEPTSFPSQFHIPVDVRPLVIRGEEIRTLQDVADGIVTLIAYYVHNRVTAAQDNSDSRPGVAKTEVPDTATEVPLGSEPEPSGPTDE